MSIHVTRSSMPSFEEYCNEIRDLWDSRWLTNMGTKHRQLQENLEAYLQAPHVTLFANGHLALEYILSAMGLPAGGEVITTPFTFASTTHAIVRSGLVPVFCDVNDTDYTMDTTKLEALITKRTCAILPVHVYGNLCDVDAIKAIADKHGLKVIYDAAHAFGVTRSGVSAANFGDASMFSFHATKVFHTIEGGAVAYADSSLTEALDAAKNFGIRSQEDAVCAGGNGKMNEFQAAMGLCNLGHIDDEITKRKAAVMHYRRRLGGVPGIRLCAEQQNVASNYAYFPVVFEGYRFSRDEIAAMLAEQGIMARKYFYPLTNSFSCYADLPTAGADKTPVAKYLADRVLTLPLYAGLTNEEVDRICNVILA